MTVLARREALGTPRPIMFEDGRRCVSCGVRKLLWIGKRDVRTVWVGGVCDVRVNQEI
jgi:hypothetical protein